MIFSIIIPIYNVENCLESTLESVLKQTKKNYEVLLIDDGSTDKSSDICKKYCNEENNWFYFKKQNGGLSDARNYGLKKAKGEYIIFLDGDDQIIEETTKYFEKVIEDNTELDVITGLGERVEENKNTNFEVTLREGIYDGETYFFTEMSANTLNMAVWLRIYSKKYLKKNNLWFKFNRLHEDEEFSPRVLLEAKKIYVTNFLFYKYLIREDSITQAKNKTQNGLDIIQTMRELDEYTNSRNTTVEIKNLIDNYIVFQCLNAYKMLDKSSRKKKLWPEDFLKNRSSNKKNKIKLFIFNTNKNLYINLYMLLRK
ncbi:glycosyltransferase family 2 protein [Vagococcus carniphilus]|uniref:glycosyltransferase family 2 protein n=1 Tax=Vagococcus carniphilus TaxID=218144 RepID=UPI003BA8873B